MYYKLKNKPGFWESKFAKDNWKLRQAMAEFRYTELSFNSFETMNDFLKENIEYSLTLNFVNFE